MHKLVFYIVLISIITVNYLCAQERRVISFAPLPMENEKKTIEEFLPLIDYVQSKLPIDVKFNYKKDYNDILLGFKDGSIDIAYLGPLPYAVLKKQYPSIRPLVSIKKQDGSMGYRCVIAKFKKDEIDFSKTLTVSLTQPLSTCGYYMTQKLLQEKFAVALEEQRYAYTMSHVNALTSVLEGKYMLAGVQEEFAHKYESLGMEIIAMSEEQPLLSIVVNTKTLSSEEIKAIRETLLNIPVSEYKKWGSIVEYGFTPSDVKAYDALKIEDAIPEKGNM
ncbi:MAG: PhnD/SsuA/transferrin family substrate-binding protein [Sulfurimonas sp.]|nr:PhnD/SsuA/transferrin family substrate-binding protein [Sulfurimonas sp.]